MNIILCGLPGSGKSTIGKLLAEKMNGTFIDNDQLIEQEHLRFTGERIDCRKIYIQKGASYFRDLECSTLASLANKPLQNTVVALGGGALEILDNIASAKAIGTLVYLKASPQDLFQRIKDKGLPAYLDPKDPIGSFVALSAKRNVIFETASDMHIDVNQLTPEDIVNLILQKRPKKIQVSIQPAPINTPIIIQEGFLESETFVKHLQSIAASLYVIITDKNLEEKHGHKMLRFLKSRGLNVSLFSIPPGEDSKTRESKELCENHILKLGGGRNTCVIGFGGGVIVDLAGYLASTYMRGVPAIMIPTSLLAMVDASIGGKNGVNVPEGKNLIGTICQPRGVFIDPKVLQTLSLDEIKNGVVEMIKHGLIADKMYFDFMKMHFKDLLEGNSGILEKAIYDSIAIKAGIVMEDPTELGKRRLLNFGHTFGHAIETATRYEITHGRAVAIGIMAASYLSKQMGHLPESDFTSIRDIFDCYDIDLTWKNKLDPHQVLECMKMDKKSNGKTPRFVLIEQIGKPMEFNETYCTTIDERLLINTIEWMCAHVMQCH